MSRYKTAAAVLLVQKLELDAKEDLLLTKIIAPMVFHGRLNQHYARRRRQRNRHSWSSVESALTDRQFRSYFRMSKALFQRLCDEIEVVIGEDEFKSKEFLNELKNSDNTRRSRMLIANEHTSGGFISGEVKLATALRILGGGSPLDMALLFDISFASAYKMFHHVVANWLSHELFCPLMASNTVQMMPAWRVWLYNFVRRQQES